MRFTGIRTLVAPAVVAGAVAACGGGEIVAVVSFVGSIGGSWIVDDQAVAGFQQRTNCGVTGTAGCFVNIQPIGTQSLYSPDANVSFTGNLPGCPSVPRTDGTISGTRITLPGCFSGQYVTINEAVSDSGTDRAYFDSAVPSLAPGVWVEIQKEERRFKFASNTTGCELTTPTRTAVAVTIVPADLSAPVPVLQTEITAFTIGTETWTGRFVGMSGMRLTRGSAVLELERRDLPDVC